MPIQKGKILPKERHIKMSDEIKEISSRLDKMRQEYLKGKHENLSYVLWGFSLAMVSLTITNPVPVSIIITVAFFIMGWVHWFRARTVKVE
jgi:Flp pilus assembly protein TadB